MNRDIHAACGDIRKRHLALCGEPKAAALFLERFAKQLEVSVVLTELEEEVKLQPYASRGLECVFFGQEELTDELIVICGKTRFGALQNYLRHMGKREYADYISAELVECLLHGKKLMVCMGTPLMEHACLLLERDGGLKEAYSTVFFRETELLEPYMDRMQEYRHVSRYCDASVRSSCEKAFYSPKTLRAGALRPDCRVITVADYGFAGYFPQYDRDRDRVSDYLLRERMRKDMNYDLLAFSKIDAGLERLCAEGISTEEIVGRLLDADYLSQEQVTGCFEEELKRFRELEQDDDIQLGEFIAQHYRRCLSRNLYEWNEPVVSYVAERILQLLDMPALTLAREERQRMIEEHSGSELPLCPSVIRALGLDEELLEKEYRVKTYYKTRYMGFEDYIRFIAAYLNRAMDLMRFTGMDQTLEQRN